MQKKIVGDFTYLIALFHDDLKILRTLLRRTVHVRFKSLRICTDRGDRCLDVVGQCRDDGLIILDRFFFRRTCFIEFFPHAVEGPGEFSDLRAPIIGQRDIGVAFGDLGCVL